LASHPFGRRPNQPKGYGQMAPHSSFARSGPISLLPGWNPAERGKPENEVCIRFRGEFGSLFVVEFGLAAQARGRNISGGNRENQDRKRSATWAIHRAQGRRGLTCSQMRDRWMRGRTVRRARSIPRARRMTGRSSLKNRDKTGTGASPGGEAEAAALAELGNEAIAESRAGIWCALRPQIRRAAGRLRSRRKADGEGALFNAGLSVRRGVIRSLGF
jgi:hypothetical protein